MVYQAGTYLDEVVQHEGEVALPQQARGLDTPASCHPSHPHLMMSTPMHTESETPSPLTLLAQTTAAAQSWHDVGGVNLDDFPDGAVWPAVAGGVPVAVFRQGEGLYALHDLCTHGAAKLSDGWVEDGCVECPASGHL